MRLLSFLTEIEKALLAESPALDGGAWETTRMINFHLGLARLTLTPRPGNEFPAGAIFVQTFSLTDGSVSMKASLNWTGSGSFPVLAVYSTPQLNWKLEASRIASTWLEGPREVVTSATSEEAYHPLAAVAG
jgi:hypothetical protein